MVPTPTTMTPRSTSTTEAESELGEPGGIIGSIGGRLTRIPVRQRLPEPLMAYCAVAEDSVIMPAGMSHRVFPGDWVVCRGAHPIDVLSTVAFKKLYEPIEAGMLLPDPAREHLETLLGVGAARTPEALLQAVQRISDLQIGGVHVEFTPGQLEELQRRAESNGRTVQEETERIVRHLSGDVFWSV